MKPIRILLLLFFAGLFVMPPAISQEISTQGTEFWVSFMGNGFKTNTTDGAAYLKTQVLISSLYNCSGEISNPNTGWTRPFTINANGVVIIDIPEEVAYMECDDYRTPLYKSLHIVTDQPVSVYGANAARYSFDATYVLPTPALADDYIIQTYDQSKESDEHTSAFLIIAVDEGETIVDITPTVETLDGKPANQTFSLTLRQGQVYQVRSHNTVSFFNSPSRDLSGSRVTAHDCKKIAVFNGSNLTMVPTTGNDSDCIFEQAMPVQAWGRQFVVTASLGRQNKDYVKITSASNDNEIIVNGQHFATLSANESVSFRLTTTSSFIESSSRCAVYLYNPSKDGSIGLSGFGAPSMVWIAPIEQRINELAFNTFNDLDPGHVSVDNHYVNIIIESGDAGNVVLDGNPIPQNQFSSVTGNSHYMFYRQEISHGAHHLSCEGGFNAHVYGFGEATGYAYMVGSNAADLSTNIIINGETVQQFDTINCCSLSSITFDAEINYQNFNVEWDFGDETPPDHNPTTTHAFDNYALYEVTLTVTSEETPCQASSSITQTVYINLSHASDTTIHANTCYSGPTTYNEHGFSIYYNHPGTYKDSIIISNQGCDSIVHLILEVDAAYDDTDHPLKVDTCNSYYWIDSTYRTSGNFTKTFPSSLGCDSIVHLDLKLSYSPSPGKIRCADHGAVVYGAPNGTADTVAVVTNTEFFSFQYTFRVKETKHDTIGCLWNSCKWSIDKPSWVIDTIPGGVQIQNDTCYSECTVYVAEHDDNYVILTAIMNNGCDSDSCKIYLKSSFLDTDEYNTTPANFNVVPNPNNGEMNLHLEQLTGKVNIKVYDMRGALIDVIETYNDLDSKTLHYAMEHTSSGIYFFVATAKEGTIAKKVIID